MKEFKNVIVKCKKDDEFSFSRNVKFSCESDFIINADDVFCAVSTDYFGDDLREYYAICPICGHINILNEKRIPEGVKEKSYQRSMEEAFLYRKNNLKSELIYLDRVSRPKTKVIKKKI